MSFTISLLLLSLPTAVWYVILKKGILLKIKSFLLRFTVAWFLGQYISTLCIFIFAIFFSTFTSQVLAKATLLFLSLFSVFSFWLLRKDIRQLRYKKFKFIKRFKLYDFIIPLVCLLFSVQLFLPHLDYTNGKINTSPVFWDFNIHYPVIQSFAYGDNFPPQNESYSGVPMTYHYYFYLLVAVYSISGLGLILSLNSLSIIVFFIMLLGIIGLCEEIFDSRVVGYIAVLLTLTSSSLRFVNYFLANIKINPFYILYAIIVNQSHPYRFSFVKNNPFGYNGTMFNLFYFIAERHLIFAVIFIIFGFLILYRRKQLHDFVCISAGILLALFFQWNLATTIMIGCALLMLLLIAPDKRKTLLILAPFTLVFLIQVIYFKMLSYTEWFLPEAADYPLINLNFPTMMSGYRYSPLNTIGYYLYAYGLKLLVFLAGISILAKKRREFFRILVAIILPSIIIINTVQVFPLSVWDNHKFIRPMNVFIDIVSAYIIYILLSKKQFRLKLLGLFCLILLTLSGLLELFPFLNIQPSVSYTRYPTDLIRKIRIHTPPKSVFLTSSAKEILFAGRTVFAADASDKISAISIVDAAKLDSGKRKIISNNIYTTGSLTDFCGLIIKHKIDYMTFNDREKKSVIFKIIQSLPEFTGINENGKRIAVIRVNQCSMIK